MSDYTIHLDQIFRGPADLLLQLVKEEEVNIQELPLAKVCEGFLSHLQDREKSNIEYASDFLVIAATLMWLKSNAALPHEEVNLEEELNPREDLLGRLLEYRRFREVSQRLEEKAKERELCFGRGARELVEEESEIRIEDLSSWSLLENYARLMKETLFDRPYSVKGEGKLIQEYAKELLSKLQAQKNSNFFKLFGEVRDREAVIGFFVALLELVKQGAVGVEQKEPFGEIGLVLKEEGVLSLDWNLFGKRMGESTNE